ncbi:flagellar hook-length control protein FliK [Xenorhabdus sp. PR6a]|uniref:flagellar hook-length control protein FliK n=1 Tax=Xenorhabdus sp. PR6a TaxID=3025877 RepID=UPI00235A4139|nr:flagellar hook-length control protein FliK [Xenorhabdus sp. PR6a]MDC9580673.1 flagellar hook-length control protein FliK [Xenorhabdus sp. PR6a]
MNLTLLPTDLNITDKGQPALKNSVPGSPSSQFEQLLNAETASMHNPTTKPTPKADKNSLKGDKSASDNRVIKDKSETQEAARQENRAEFAISKEDSLLSAEALSAAIPIQLAGLLPPQPNSAVVPENAGGLMGDESLENILSENTHRQENAGLESENSPVGTLLDSNTLDNNTLDSNIKDSRSIDPYLAQHAKAGEQHEGVQRVANHAKQETSLNNKSETLPRLQPESAPLAEPIKLAASYLATHHEAGSDNTVFKNTVSGNLVSNNAVSNNAVSNNTVSNNIVSDNTETSNLLKIAIQAAPALATSTAETASADSPTLLATPSLFSAGQHSTGQFQLHSTTAPLLNAHLGSEEWQQQLNQQVLFFNRHGLQQAELRLHPQELGALHIRMSIEDNQAQLHFVSAHQNVRTALEAALPGLRHALAENGIQLAQSSVNSDSQGNAQQEHFANNPNSHSRSHAETQQPDLATATGNTVSHTATIRVTPQQLTLARGGVDTFA